jgi:hypothetical protein
LKFLVIRHGKDLTLYFRKRIKETKDRGEKIPIIIKSLQFLENTIRSTLEQAYYCTDRVSLAKYRRLLVYSYYKYQALLRYIRSNPKQNIQEIRNNIDIHFCNKTIITFLKLYYIKY